MLSINCMPLYAIGYSGENPKETYDYLNGEVGYMDYAFGPLMVDGEGVFLQVPLLSHPSTVVIATDLFLHGIVNGEISQSYKISKKVALDAIDRSIVVTSWSDYQKMEFEGLPFKAPKWAEWV